MAAKNAHEGANGWLLVSTAPTRFPVAANASRRACVSGCSYAPWGAFAHSPATLRSSPGTRARGRRSSRLLGIARPVPATCPNVRLLGQHGAVFGGRRLAFSRLASTGPRWHARAPHSVDHTHSYGSCASSLSLIMLVWWQSPIFGQGASRSGVEWPCSVFWGRALGCGRRYARHSGNDL